MSDLLERLKVALLDRYAVEHEIGRGGMATVFLAEDLKHDRRVAIKVLHPELAASIGGDRFLREIKVSAKLEHPNILTLIDSGETDGLPYYVMPHVEGESLAQRLDREGQLPVRDAISIAAEVADGLNCAHEQGVIHRDIKPGNILLSHGHALIADFGIARALDEAGAERMTKTGIAVGSPLYMSPEQAAGETTDARSDLYSLGCVLFEMLAGEPPFDAPSARALMAKHSMEAVPGVRVRRDVVPEALERTISQCLAKAPADRFATAADLQDELRSQLRGDVTEQQRSMLKRELGLLAGVSALALGAVLFIVFEGGLPYWMLALMGFLVLLELPFLSEIAGRLRGNRAASADGGAIPRLGSMRAGALVGAAGLAALGVGGPAVIGLGAAGIGPLSTLVSRGELSQHPLVVVADFESSVEDPELGRVIARALRDHWIDADAFEVVDRETMRQALVEMRRDPEAVINREMAIEVAERTGAEAVLTGEIAAVGSAYTLGAWLLSMPGASQLLTVREEATGSGEILQAVDRLQDRLQRGMGEPLAELRRRPSLMGSTTSSLEALRKANEAERLCGRGCDDASQERAIRLLEEAVAIDPEFALAYNLIRLWHPDLGEKEAALRTMCELSDRLAARREERSFVEFECLWWVDRNPEAAKRYARAHLGRFPDDAGFAAFYADLLQRFVEWEEAAEVAEASHRYFNRTWREPLAEAGDTIMVVEAGTAWSDDLRSWVNSLLALHEFERADSAVAAFPYWKTPADRQLERFWVAFAARDHDRAEVLLDSMPSASSRIDFFYAVTAMAEGRLADAIAYLDRVAAAGEPRLSAFFRADLEAFLRGHPDAAARTLEDALAGIAVDSLDDRQLLETSRKWSIATRPERARELVAEYERRVPEDDRRTEVYRQMQARYRGALADMALAEGRPLEAVEGYRAEYEERRSYRNPGWRTFFNIGRAFEAAGMPDSAIVAYERAVAYPGVASRSFEWLTLPLSTERLAALYDTRGNTEAALEQYRLFARLWEEADPEFQVRVEAARVRAAELAAGGV